MTVTQDEWYKGGLCFSCKQCGACCSGAPGYVWLEDAEADAIAEYRRGNEAYNNSYFRLAIEHYQNALKIVEIPSFYLAIGNGYFAISRFDSAYDNPDQ